MGTSLGANTTLEVASLAPERLRGMVIEMPVLDHALLGAAVAFTPLMLWLTLGAPAARLVARTARLVPARRLPWQVDILRRLDPPGPRAERRGHPGPVLRPHRAAPRRAPHVRGADAGDRPPVRHDPPVLRRRHAGRGAAERPAPAGQLDRRAAPGARPAHRRDRRVPRRMLEAAGGGGRRRRAPSGPWRSAARPSSARRASRRPAGRRRPRHPPRSAARGRRAR